MFKQPLFLANTKTINASVVDAVNSNMASDKTKTIKHCAKNITAEHINVVRDISKQIAGMDNMTVENDPADKSRLGSNLGKPGIGFKDFDKAMDASRLNIENASNRQSKQFQGERQSGNDLDGGTMKCAFCDDGIEADVCCEDCCITYCIACFQALHPMKGPFQTHVISSKNTPVCKQHSLKFTYFCKECNKCICIDCARDNLSHKFHKFDYIGLYVKQEKKKVMKRLDNTNVLMSKLSSIPTTADKMQDTLEFDWLLKKEKIRQEFVSLHEILIVREEKLLQGMEVEIDKSLNALTDIKDRYTDLCIEETAVTLMSVDLVKEESKIQFVQQKDAFEKRRLELNQRIQHFLEPGTVTTPFLSTPFSLYKEKCHLDKALRMNHFINPDISIRSATVYLTYDMVYDPISAGELWHPVRTGPSVTVFYKLELCKKKTVVWAGIVRYQDKVLNVEGKPSLLFGERYTLHVTPVFSCSMGRSCSQSYEGRHSSILIVTGDLDVSVTPILASVYLSSDFVCDPISSCTLWHPVKIFSSANVSYKVELYLKGFLVWTELVKYGDGVLNGDEKHRLLYGTYYSLKVTPVFSCFTDKTCSRSDEGRHSIIFIVTGAFSEHSFPKDPFSWLHVDSCYISDSTSFEAVLKNCDTKTSKVNRQIKKKPARTINNKGPKTIEGEKVDHKLDTTPVSGTSMGPQTIEGEKVDHKLDTTPVSGTSMGPLTIEGEKVDHKLDTTPVSGTSMKQNDKQLTSPATLAVTITTTSHKNNKNPSEP